MSDLKGYPVTHWRRFPPSRRLGCSSRSLIREHVLRVRLSCPCNHSSRFGCCVGACHLSRPSWPSDARAKTHCRNLPKNPSIPVPAQWGREGRIIPVHIREDACRLPGTFLGLWILLFCTGLFFITGFQLLPSPPCRKATDGVNMHDLIVRNKQPTIVANKLGP